MSRTRHHGDKKKERLFGDKWRWLESEPKWFRKLNKHRRYRNDLRKALSDLQKFEHTEVHFPLANKPRIYYW